MADFVLVHGTTQAPQGWDRLVAALRSRGHRSIAVDLAGGDERSVAEYAEEVSRQVPADVNAPIVVAHSGTGPVLPATARLLDAQRQVWLAAIVPDGRRPLLEEIRSAPTEIFNPEWPGKDPTEDPVGRLPPVSRLRSRDIAVGAEHAAAFCTVRALRGRGDTATEHPVDLCPRRARSNAQTGVVPTRGETASRRRGDRDRCRALPTRVPARTGRRHPRPADVDSRHR